MSASLQKRLNCCVAAIYRFVPRADSCTAAIQVAACEYAGYTGIGPRTQNAYAPSNRAESPASKSGTGLAEYGFSSVHCDGR